MTTPIDLELHLSRHGTALRRLAADLLRDGASADDVVQEVWLRALQRPPRHETSIGGWLATMVKNTASTLRRGERRRIRHETDAATAQAAEGVEDAAAGVARRLRAQRLLAAVAELDAPFCDAIWQRYFEGMAPREIAARSGVSLATVKSRLQRGLNQLRETLGEEAESDWRGPLAIAFGLPTSAVPIGAAAVSTTTWSGVLLMTIWTKMLAAIAIVAVACVSLWSLNQPDKATASSVVAGFADDVEPTVELSTTVAVPSVPASVLAIPDEAAAERELVTGRAVGAVGEQVVVRTIDAKTRQPIAGVEVWWIDDTLDPDSLSARQASLRGKDAELYTRELGQRTVSDANGQFVLRARSSLGLVARSDMMFGQAFWNVGYAIKEVAPFEGELPILLEQDHTLVVRAIDRHQQPVSGALIRLIRHDVVRSGEVRRSPQDMGVTDEAGQLTLPHAQRIFWDGDREAELCAVVVGAEGEARPLDPLSLPEGVVDVVVAPMGTVAVVLLSPEGKPWLFPEHNHIYAWLRPDPERIPQRVAGVDYKPFGMDGRVTFQVGCGLSFHASVSHWVEQQGFEGPKLEGDLVQVELKMAADQLFLAGRLLGEDGGPFVGNAAMRITANGSSSDWLIDRDTHGRFCFPVLRDIGELPELLVRESGVVRRAGLQRSVPLQASLHPGRNELGDIVLQRPPLLVSGQLVFLGEPDIACKPGAVVLRVERCAKPGDDFGEANGFRVVVDEAQNFTVHDVGGAHAYRLVLGGGCVMTGPIDFVPGATDVKVAVSPGGSVDASFLCDEVHRDLRIRLMQESVPEREGEALRDQREWRELGQSHLSDGRLDVAWRNVPVGKHRLVVGLQGEDPVVDLLVDVSMGRLLDDPRLVDIDLRGRVRTILVRLTDALGQPLASNATVVLAGRHSTGEPGLGGMHDATTPSGVRLPLTKPRDLFVVGDGLRGTRVSGVASDVTVAMAPATTVEVHWLDAPTLPPGVWAQLAWSPIDWPAREPDVPLGEAHGGSHSVTLRSLLVGAGLPTRLRAGRAMAHVEAVVPLELKLFLRKAGRKPNDLGLRLRIDPAHLVHGQVVELQVADSVVQAAIRELAR